MRADQQQYQVFAEFYDQAMGDRSDITEYLHEVLEEYAPHAQSMLELAVGTGSILSDFTAIPRLAGIDASPAMLELAQQKVPQARLELGDMSQFALGEHYDVIICLFDSINHLTDFEDWRSLFECVAEHLSPGGVFVFDMNTLGRLQKVSNILPLRQNFGDMYMLMTVRPHVKQIYNCEVSFFKNTSPPHLLARETILETSFPLHEVQAAAEEHLRLISLLDQTGEPASDHLDRAFFIFTTP